MSQKENYALRHEKECPITGEASDCETCPMNIKNKPKEKTIDFNWDK